MDTKLTKVCFIDFNGEVTAIFPELYDRQYLTCYAHIGQHGSCCTSLLSDYKHLRVGKKKVKALYRELTTRGYNLEPISRKKALKLCNQ